MPNHHCCALGCTSDSRKKQNLSKYPWMKDVTFFRFPVDDKGKLRWLQMIRKPSMTLDKINKHTRLCSLHWKNSTGPGSTGSLPTLFAHNNYTEETGEVNKGKRKIGLDATCTSNHGNNGKKMKMDRQETSENTDEHVAGTTGIRSETSGTGEHSQNSLLYTDRTDSSNHGNGSELILLETFKMEPLSPEPPTDVEEFSSLADLDSISQSYDNSTIDQSDNNLNNDEARSATLNTRTDNIGNVDSKLPGTCNTLLSLLLSPTSKRSRTSASALVKRTKWIHFANPLFEEGRGFMCCLAAFYYSIHVPVVKWSGTDTNEITKMGEALFQGIFRADFDLLPESCRNISVNELPKLIKIQQSHGSVKYKLTRRGEIGSSSLRTAWDMDRLKLSFLEAVESSSGVIFRTVRFSISIFTYLKKFYIFDSRNRCGHDGACHSCGQPVVHKVQRTTDLWQYLSEYISQTFASSNEHILQYEITPVTVERLKHLNLFEYDITNPTASPSEHEIVTLEHAYNHSVPDCASPGCQEKFRGLVERIETLQSQVTGLENQIRQLQYISNVRETAIEKAVQFQKNTEVCGGEEDLEMVIEESLLEATPVQQQVFEDSRDDESVEDVHICKVCWQRFPAREVYKYEGLGNALQGTDQNVYVCEHCDLWYVGGLSTYIAGSGDPSKQPAAVYLPDDYDKVCMLCGKAFHTKWNYIGHLYSTHPIPGPGVPKPLRCERCKKRYNQTYGFILHVTGYCCIFCQRSFSGKSEYESHVELSHDSPRSKFSMKHKSHRLSTTAPVKKCQKHFTPYVSTVINEGNHGNREDNNSDSAGHSADSDADTPEIEANQSSITDCGNVSGLYMLQGNIKEEDISPVPVDATDSADSDGDVPEIEANQSSITDCGNVSGLQSDIKEVDVSPVPVALQSACMRDLQTRLLESLIDRNNSGPNESMTDECHTRKWVVVDSELVAQPELAE